MERKRVRAKPPQEYRSDPAGEEVWRGKGDVTFVRRSRRIALAKRIRTSKDCDVRSLASSSRTTTTTAEVCQPSNTKMVKLLANVTKELCFKDHDVTMQDTDATFEEEKGSTDPLAMAPYASDILQYYKDREVTNNVERAALNVEPLPRRILVDWLVDVQNHLLLDPETLHLAVALIDSYLARRPISLNLLQLLGVTCLFVACKFEEILVPEIETLCDLCMKAYNKEQMLTMERKVCRVLNYSLFYPTALNFLNAFFTMAEIKPNEKLIFTAQYLVDMALPDVVIHVALPSLRAAAAFYLAGLLCRDELADGTGQDARTELVDAVGLLDVDFITKITGYPESQLRWMSRKMMKTAQSIPHEDHRAPYNKFNCEAYHFVSSRTALADVAHLFGKL